MLCTQLRGIQLNGSVVNRTVIATIDPRSLRAGTIINAGPPCLITRKFAWLIYDDGNITPNAQPSREVFRVGATGGVRIIDYSWRHWFRENFPNSFREKIDRVINAVNKHKDFLIEG